MRSYERTARTWVRLTFALALAILFPRVALAQFVVEGVIHDAERLLPLDGVLVLVVDDASGQAVSPGAFADPTQQGQITGADGRYRVELAEQRIVRLELSRPDVRFVFPSVTRPPEGGGRLGGVACSAVPCPGNALSASDSPTADGAYALRFDSNPALSARNNHIPIDPLDRAIRATIEQTPERARLGDAVTYSIRVEDDAPDLISDAEVVVALPSELRLSQDSLQVERTSISGSVAVLPVRVTQEDLFLRIGGFELLAGDRLRVRFVARVVQRSVRTSILTRAWVERTGAVRVSNEAQSRLRVEDDPTLEQSTVLGQVFCDGTGPRDGWPDEGEPGLFGARVYLDTGLYAESDESGLFHFSGVPAGTRLVKLDAASLPPGSALRSDALVQLYLSPGTPAKVRFAVTCALERWSTPTKVEVARAPEAPPETASSGPQTLALSVDRSARRVGLGDHAFPFLDPRLFAEATARGVTFFPRARSSVTPVRWMIIVEEVDAAGTVVRALRHESLTGRGMPPVFLELATSPPPGGALRAVLELRANDTDFARSAPVDVLAPRPVAVVPTGERESITTLEAAMAPDQIPRKLEALAPQLSRRAAEEDRVVVVRGHWDGGVSAEEAEAASRELAERIRDALAQAGVPRARTVVEAMGSAEPIVPNLSPRIRRQNRRVELLLASAPPPARVEVPRPAPPAAALGLGVDGKEALVPFEGRARLDFSIDLDVPAQVTLTLHDGEGGMATLRRVVTAARVTYEDERISVTPALSADGRRLTLGPVEVELPALARVLESVTLDGSVTPSRISVRAAPDPTGVRWAMALVDPASGRTLAATGGEGAPPASAQLALTSSAAQAGGELTFVVEHAGGDRAVSRRAKIPAVTAARIEVQLAEPGPVRVGLVGEPDAAGELFVNGRVLRIGDGPSAWIPLPVLEALPRPGEAEKGAAMAPANLPAAQVTMEVPAASAELSSLSLPIRGQTRPENRIVINGDVVPVASDGSFSHRVELEPGHNRVRVESQDELGNLARFDRGVRTSSSAWFLMALAEGQVTTGGAALAGSNAHTRIEGSAVSLDARAIAYGRGRFVWKDGFFTRISLVGRLDTGEQGGPSIARLEDDPLRLLPAFGDASLEVQDAASRHKIFLDVTADESRLTVGNASTELGAVQGGFFSFRRSGFGVHGELVKRFSDVDETRIVGVVGIENEGIARGHDELTGTGGTMFWLSHDELVEGSERVRVEVRDRDTGMVLASEVKARGVDYELRPREGRITFRRPIPHVASQGTTVLNRSVALTGHPIYVVVDYEHLASTSDDLPFGAEFRETLFDQLELYAGVAGENREDGRHRLYGLALAWRPTLKSSFVLEYAQSAGDTSLGRLSVDGGLTFLDLDARVSALSPSQALGRTLPFFGALDETAMGVTGLLDLSDLGSGEERPRGFVRAYGRKAGLGFSSLSAGRTAGRLEAGIAAAYGITDEVTVRGSFDGALAVDTSSPIISDEVSGLFRGLGVLGADYEGDDQGGSLEVAHLITSFSPVTERSSATGISGRYERRVSKRLTLRIMQDAVVSADDYIADDLGRLGTTVGATWTLTDALELDVAEMVRWDGANASQVGLRVRAEDGMTAYVAERLGRAEGRPLMTTIVGAEDQVTRGSRTYGELQMDGGLHPSTTRAVLGMDNRWEVAEGLGLLLAYERAQLAANTAAPTATAPGPFAAPFGGLGTTLGGFGNPVVLLPGAVSRDALALGFDYRGLSRLKLSTRLELRVDDGPEFSGGRDFFTVGVHSGVAFKAHRDITALGRVTFQHVRDTETDLVYAKALEWSLGAMLRPRHEDWFTMLVRYTRLQNQRPPDEDGLRTEDVRNALSIEPIVDTPWRVQLVERVALVNETVKQDGLPNTSGWLVLWVNRVNARILDELEAGVEYRMLLDLEAETGQRGFLLEAGYIPEEHIRIGLGYNFTSFSDDVLTLTSENAGGPFLRVTGRY